MGRAGARRGDEEAVGLIAGEPPRLKQSRWKTLRNRLWRRLERRISAAMRLVPLLPYLIILACVGPAWAQAQRTAAPAKPAPATGPKELGKFDDWIAATHPESGQTVCYAFVRASRSTPTLPGRGDVVLTVTERPGGRDAVAITAGFNYAPAAAVTVQVATSGLDFYTSKGDAFARDGKAVVAAFQKGEQALARSPGPRDGQVVVDTFSLHGFSAAYAAINKACPAPR
ncbi:MAG TPA: invasion associated locus B family protein [Acetobacteraceae bacterium]|nr:invasion associated locus B family protein [Acetobacteraceae bacterium]